MHVDGSSTNSAAGGGVFMIMLGKRLRLTSTLRAKNIKVNSDSQLVVGQVRGEYGAKDG